MKKTFVCFLVSLLTTISFAYECSIGNLNYDINKELKTAKVVYRYYNNSYLSIPSTISVEGQEYKVTSIGENAFSNNSDLQYVVIPNSVDSINNRAFSNCRNIYSISVPNTLKYIGEGAFSYCSEITSFTLPESLESIEASTFQGCTKLTSIKIPNSVKKIKSYAFYSSGLKQINFGTGLETISYYAFYHCSSLTSLTFNNGLKTISNNAFNECGSLTSVYIPKTVTSIDYLAFFGSNKLSSIVFEDANTLEYIGNIAFGNNNPWYSNLPSGLNYIGNILYCYKGSMPFGTSLKIKEGTTLIREFCFQYMENLESIELPSTLKTIEELTFYNCNGLKYIKIPSSLTKIKGLAFSGCKSLQTIECFAETPPTFSFYNGSTENFQDVPSTCVLRVPSSAIELYQTADQWRKFSNIGAISIASGSCGSSATWILYEDGELVITGTGDVNGYSYKSATIPWYNYLSQIKKVTIEEGITSIGQNVFRTCSNLTEVTVPSSLTYFGEDVFRQADNIKAVYISNLDNWLKMGYFGNSSCPLREETDLILNGQLVTNIEFPSSMTSIEAFYGCKSLKSITIPSTVKSINNYSFFYCSGLEEIYNYAKYPQSLSYVWFDYVPTNTCELFVESESIQKYKTANFWSKFSNIKANIKGDVSKDGEVNISDVTSLTNIIISNNENTRKADINSDGNINIADIAALIDLLLGNETKDEVLIDSHEYVDLGLPTGTLWATMNVGANSPEEYGNYYAWGETKGYDEEDMSNTYNYKYGNTYKKTYYSWVTYKWSGGSKRTLTKYNYDISYGNVVYRATLDYADDAAYVNWGENWRMPSNFEQTELRDNCYWEWTDSYKGTGTKGFIVYKVKSDLDKGVKIINGSSISTKASYSLSDTHIFLPAAGYRYNSSLNLAGSYGHYWSSSLHESYPDNAYYLYFNSSSVDCYYSTRSSGRSVRPVRRQ